MKFDLDKLTLSFASHQEVGAFHQQVTDLIRIIMVDVNKEVVDPQQAKQRSAEVMKEFRTVMRALNLIRRAIRKEK